jgi:hypothetical protein
MIVINGYGHKIHFCKRIHIEKNYRINSIMKILKFSHLSLNIFKCFQIIWEVMLLDRVL